MKYQAISFLSLTKETRVPPHTSQCGICGGGQSVTETAFCVLRVPPSRRHSANALRTYLIIYYRCHRLLATVSVVKCNSYVYLPLSFHLLQV